MFPIHLLYPYSYQIAILYHRYEPIPKSIGSSIPFLLYCIRHGETDLFIKFVPKEYPLDEFLDTALLYNSVGCFKYMYNNEDGEHLASYAYENKCMQIVYFLIERGINLEQLFADAIGRSDVPFIKYILDMGVWVDDVVYDLIASFQYQLLMLILSHPNVEFDSDDLVHFAIEYDNSDCVELFLNSHKFDGIMNFSEEEYTWLEKVGLFL
jgi:hypothetical protein